MEINHFQNRRNKSTFMKVSSIVLSMSQSDPDMSVRAAPSTPLSIKSIAPGCVNSRFVKYEVYLEVSKEKNDKQINLVFLS